MAIIIKNMNDLTRMLQIRTSKALELTRDEMFKVFQKHISEYYKEPVFRDGSSAIPIIYDRTYKLLNALIKTNIVVRGTSIFCSVEIDQNYLNYMYIGGATGLDVMLSANEQFHGWSIEGDIKIWDDALEELGMEYGIRALMIKNLIKCGVPVK